MTFVRFSHLFTFCCYCLIIIIIIIIIYLFIYSFILHVVIPLIQESEWVHLR